ILDGELRVRLANRSFYQTFQVRPEDTVGRLLCDLGNRQWDIPRLRKLLGEILARNIAFDDFAAEHDFPTIGKRVMMLNGCKLHDELILLALEDVTARMRPNEQAAGQRRLQALFDTSLDAILMADDQARYVDANPAACALLGYDREELLQRGVF